MLSRSPLRSWSHLPAWSHSRARQIRQLQVVWYLPSYPLHRASAQMDFIIGNDFQSLARGNHLTDKFHKKRLQIMANHGKRAAHDDNLVILRGSHGPCWASMAFSTGLRPPAPRSMALTRYHLIFVFEDRRLEVEAVQGSQRVSVDVVAIRRWNMLWHVVAIRR